MLQSVSQFYPEIPVTSFMDEPYRDFGLLNSSCCLLSMLTRVSEF